MLTLFLTSYGAVFAAELVGDKLVYTTGVLATRYRALPIMSGMGLAFMVKMGVAVLVGDAVAHMPPLFVASLTALSFFGIAYALWQTPDSYAESRRDQEHSSKAVLMTFATIFFSEWGDVGQITAAAVASRYSSALLVVWLGAVAAMITKGALAAFLGAGLRQWITIRISPKTMRYAGVAAMIVLCVAALAEELTRGA